MRLFLSSWYLRPGQQLAGLRPRSGRGRAGIVLNALDQFGETRSLRPGPSDGAVPDPAAWRSGYAESELIDRAEAYLAQAGQEYRCLRDGEAFVVEGDEIVRHDLGPG